MTTDQNNVAAATPESGPAQPAEFRPPEGKMLLDADEHAALLRDRDRAKGMQSYFDSGRKAGFTRSEEFEQYGKLKQLADAKRIPLDNLIQAFSMEDQGGQPDPGIDSRLEGYISRDEFAQTLSRERAMAHHERAMADEQKAVERIMAEVMGENPSARDKALIPVALKALLMEKRGMYPADHPLHGEQLAAYDGKTLDSIRDEFRKMIALQEAEEIVAPGKKPQAASPAGSSMNTPSRHSAANEPGPLPGSPEHRASVEEFRKRQLARRGGGPVSAAGS